MGSVTPQKSHSPSLPLLTQQWAQHLVGVKSCRQAGPLQMRARIEVSERMMEMSIFLGEQHLPAQWICSLLPEVGPELLEKL